MADEISSPSAIARLMRCPSIGSSRLAIRDLGWTGDNEGTRIGAGRWPARLVAGPNAYVWQKDGCTGHAGMPGPQAPAV